MDLRQVEDIPPLNYNSQAPAMQLQTNKASKAGRRSLGNRTALLQQVFKDQSQLTGPTLVCRIAELGGPRSLNQRYVILRKWETAGLVFYFEGMYSLVNMVSPTIEVNHVSQ